MPRFFTNAMGSQVLRNIQENHMHNRVSMVIVPLLATAVACVQPVNTVPAPVTPAAQVQRYDLELPPDLDIKAVDFSATTFTDVSGAPNAGTSSSVGGRAFVKVYAVHRTTGEQFLVLYEDVQNRRRPIQIIRFVRGSDPARPDTAR
jgi:hypothetical protein